MSSIEQLANKLSAANSFEVAKKDRRKQHRRKLEESTHESETKEEKELRKKKKMKEKEKEKTKTDKDLARAPKHFETHIYKGKKRHAEHEMEQAGSNTEKQHKKARLDPLLSSSINSENKKERKHKSSSDVSEIVLKKTKHKSETREHRDKEKRYQRNQGEDSISCNQGTDNFHVCLEPSTLEKSGGAHSFSGSFLESRTREGQHKKKKKKKKQKEKERNRTVQDLTLINVNGDNVLEGNAEDKKKRKKSSTDISEKIVSQNTKHKSQTEKYREKEKCSQNHQGEDGISCKQGTENIHDCLEPSTLERSDDADFSLQVDRYLDSRKDRQLKKKRKKEKKEKEKNKAERETTFVRNDHELTGNEVFVSRAETTSKNTHQQQNNEKLREAIVHTDTIHETWKVSEEKIKELKEKGIKVKMGKWSLQELKLLQSNMDRFLLSHDLQDPDKLLFHSRVDKEESRFWRSYARTNDFYKELGKGILRPLNQIYKCAKRLWDPANYVGKYSDEEVKELRRLYAIHGRDWVTIGALLGRSRMSVNRKHSKLPATKGPSGRWTDDEIKQLKEAVYVVTNTAADQPVPFQGIYWPAVAQIVKTRNIEQCRRKWLERLCWMEEDKEKTWTKENELKLITRLYNSGVTEDCDVDWMELKSEFQNNYTPQWLRKKWLEIKRKAPDYHKSDFEDIVDYLYNVHGKTLRSQLVDETSSKETN